MQTSFGILTAAVFFVGCEMHVAVDTTPPAPPAGIRYLSLDNAVQLDWQQNTEPDLAGYHVWVAPQYDGSYQKIGTTSSTTFLDEGVHNGQTYYYAVSAFDRDGNESALSTDFVYATPRPEGYNVRIFDFNAVPAMAGYDFSSATIGPYNDKYSDLFFERYNGVAYLDVWNDTEIQDMGYTRSFDEITAAPIAGWAPSHSAEAIVGHTYVIHTWDKHYAKVRLISVGSDRMVFDWAYQVAQGNVQLKAGAGHPTQRGDLHRPTRL